MRRINLLRPSGFALGFALRALQRQEDRYTYINIYMAL